MRVVLYDKLTILKMEDTTWGWNIEMNVKAIQNRFKIKEIPIKYRKRHGGRSKISGNWKLIFPVGIRILYTFFKLMRDHKN
jgi:hypothetical protein